MIKKIFWFLVILFVSYLLLIFIFPWTTKKIESVLWMNWFNDNVIEVKNKIDKISTDWIELYNDTKITTKSFVDHFYHWLNIIKSNIDKLREKINEKKTDAEKLKKSYEDVKEIINTASWIIKETKDTIDTLNDVKNTITNTWKLYDNTNTWNIN